MNLARYEKHFTCRVCLDAGENDQETDQQRTFHFRTTPVDSLQMVHTLQMHTMLILFYNSRLM